MTSFEDLKEQIAELKRDNEALEKKLKEPVKFRKPKKIKIRGLKSRYLAYEIGYLERYFSPPFEGGEKPIDKLISSLDNDMACYDLICLVSDNKVTSTPLPKWIRDRKLVTEEYNWNKAQRFFNENAKEFNECIIFWGETDILWPNILDDIISVLSNIGHCACIGCIYEISYMKTEIGDITYVNDDTESG